MPRIQREQFYTHLGDLTPRKSSPPPAAPQPAKTAKKTSRYVSLEELKRASELAQKQATSLSKRSIKPIKPAEIEMTPL